MITQEQYNYLNSFRGIITMFVEQQTYVGGGDALFDYYTTNFNLGNSINKSCPTCMAGCLLHCSNMIKEYENRNL